MVSYDYSINQHNTFIMLWQYKAENTKEYQIPARIFWK